MASAGIIRIGTAFETTAINMNGGQGRPDLASRTDAEWGINQIEWQPESYILPETTWPKLFENAKR